MIYTKHVFICTNQRMPGAARSSCGEAHGLALVSEFKRLLKEKKLNVNMRAQKTGCLDICDFGPTVVVYPEAVWYVNVQLNDVAEIVESHLQNNIPVDRLLLKHKRDAKQNAD
ncbi:MAG: (2Fe-2S) ferredoxin domain-containing protein [Bacteroidia bacterium]|nr:(2Fe-2S) ferredoxin domain-containing protein [Bacteroidia bacterium]